MEHKHYKPIPPNGQMPATPRSDAELSKEHPGFVSADVAREFECEVTELKLLLQLSESLANNYMRQRDDARKLIPGFDPIKALKLRSNPPE